MEIQNNNSGKGGPIRPHDDARGVRGTERGHKPRAPKSDAPAASRESAAKPAARADRIDLSAGARYLASEAAAPTEEAAEYQQERVKFIQNVRELVQEGRLNTQERIETAAHKMLGGE